MIATCPHVEPTQQKIAVRCAVEPAVLTETGVVANLRCDESSLVFPSAGRSLLLARPLYRHGFRVVLQRSYRGVLARPVREICGCCRLLL
jgi:hypothetical protein